MSNEIESLKQYFKSKHSHVSDVFLEACFEWVRNQYDTNTTNELYDKVYEQYLLVDLRELQIRVLPQNVSKNKKTTLQGNYVLQAMCFKDISKSSYSQLKIIRNLYKLTRSNIEKDNEPPGKRTLYLNLTDGVECINAFEYETVTCLSLYMKPGVKLLLIGPLMIRNGEILLKNSNVKVLGGEVEDLLVSNSVENVLARELNLPENPNAGVLNPETLEENIQNETDYTSDGFQAYNVQPQNNNKRQKTRHNCNGEVRMNDFNDDDDLLLAEMAIEDFEEQLEDFETNHDNERRQQQERENHNQNVNYQQERNVNNRRERNENNRREQNVNNRRERNVNNRREENVNNRREKNVNNRRGQNVNNRQERNVNSQSNDEEYFESQSDDFEEYFQNEMNDQECLQNEMNDQECSQEDTRMNRKETREDEFDFDDCFSNFEFEDEPMDSPKEISTFPIIVSAEPYIYIKQLLDDQETLLNKTFCVKAQFWKVIKKLAFDNSKGWTLKCVITDGTGVINVDFLNEVLEEIIGMTREEANVLKQKWKNKESGAAEKLGRIIYECKDKLVALNCFMYLRFVNQIETATVIGIKEVERSDMDVLRNRVNTLRNE